MKKETILRHEGFIGNEHLDQYLKLTAKDSLSLEGPTRHHVIPVCWYRLKFPDIQSIGYRSLANHDKDERVVWLSREDHMKARELLTLCAEGELKSSVSSIYRQRLSAIEIGSSNGYIQNLSEDL